MATRQDVPAVRTPVIRRAAAKGLFVLALAALIGVMTPSVVQAGVPAPVRPTGVRAVDVTASGFTAVIAKAPHTSHYRVFVSANKPDVYVSNLRSHHTLSVVSTKPVVVVRGLAYRTTPYWYRIEAYNKTRIRYSGMYAVSLAPPTPTGLQATSSTAGLSLTWNSGAATGFTVVAATDPGFADGRITFTLRGSDHQFTPYGLTPGTTYYFAVRALNGSTPSAYSVASSATAQTSEQAVRVMSYNVLEDTGDGTVESGQVVAPWSERVIGAAKLIEQGAPDVVSVQEAAGWVGPASAKKRQIDDLAAHLGGTYALARTEIPPTEPHYFRTGVYILYNQNEYATVGTGDHWVIGADSRVAAYQELQSRSTGARFLFVSVHEMVGGTAGDNTERASETTTMINDATSYAAAHGNIPIVYAGDFNSYPTAQRPVDGPTAATRAAHVVDAYEAAQALSNANYDSSNLYDRTPPAYGDSIDHVFAGPGVGVQSFAVVVDLVRGKFVGVIPSDHNPIVSTLTVPYS